MKYSDFILSDDGKTLYGISNGLYNKKEIIIPEGVERISITNFQNKIDGINKVVFPTTLKSIEASSFELCCYIKELVFLGDDSVYIHPYAFAYCDELVTVKLPKNQEYINDFVFYGCAKLKKVFNASNIKIVNKYAFGECHSLERFDWKGISILEEGAFYNCRNLFLGDLELSSIEVVKPYTFAGCGEGALTLPSTLKVIESFGFANSNVNLRGTNQCFKNEWSVGPMPTKLIIKSYAFAGSRIGVASFPIYGEYIVEDYAFDHCNALETICVSGDIKIGDKAFSNVYSRVTVYRYSGNNFTFDNLKVRNSFVKVNHYIKWDNDTLFKDRKFSKHVLNDYKFRDYCVRNDKMGLYRNVHKVKDKFNHILPGITYPIKGLKAVVLEFMINKKR